MKRFAILVVLGACASNHYPPFEHLPDSTLAFTPSKVTIERFASQCGVQHPIFQDSDLYDLTVLGKPVQQNEHPSMITVTFHRTLPLNSDLGATLQPFGVMAYSIDAQGNKTNIEYGQSGMLPMSDNSFEWWQGTDASELDPMPLTDAVVRIDQMPHDDGELGALTLRLTFTDGGVWDAEMSAALSTAFSGCGAG